MFRYIFFDMEILLGMEQIKNILHFIIVYPIFYQINGEMCVLWRKKCVDWFNLSGGCLGQCFGLVVIHLKQFARFLKVASFPLFAI